MCMEDNAGLSVNVQINGKRATSLTDWRESVQIIGMF